MKRLITLFAVLGLTLAVSAQTFYSLDFLNCKALQITNLISFTNLVSAGGRGTNITGMVWTNLAGDKVLVSATNSAATNDVTHNALVKDLYFPTDLVWRYGQANINALTNSAAASPFAASIEICGVGGSGANAADTLVFQWILDKDGTVSTEDTFTASFTPNTTTAVNYMTNVTVRQLTGYVGIRLKYALAGDTDASSQVALTKLRFNCWGP